MKINPQGKKDIHAVHVVRGNSCNCDRYNRIRIAYRLCFVSSILNSNLVFRFVFVKVGAWNDVMIKGMK